ncbi:hypothetical protein KM043_002747 [Ampulex compressa]|nr:hypothetical protein KM043_002747 [Ampulex compressa]
MREKKICRVIATTIRYCDWLTGVIFHHILVVAISSAEVHRGTTGTDGRRLWESRWLLPLVDLYNIRKLSEGRKVLLTLDKDLLHALRSAFGLSLPRTGATLRRVRTMTVIRNVFVPDDGWLRAPARPQPHLPGPKFLLPLTRAFFCRFLDADPRFFVTATSSALGLADGPRDGGAWSSSRHPGTALFLLLCDSP